MFCRGGGGGEGGIKKINLARKQKGSNFLADQAKKILQMHKKQ